MFECIPNISEGRNECVIQEAVEAIRSSPSVKLLHVDSGYDANRTVFTFIGDEKGIEASVLNLYSVCLRRVDLKTHLGTHPRIGALDVCPIVPLKKAYRDRAIQLAKRIGVRVSTELNIPVYFYELNQEIEYRRSLSAIRRGQFEGLVDKFQLKDWAPDAGPSSPHPSFGATVIGARNFLIAYNVSLDSRDVLVAKEIAKQLRGYRTVQDNRISQKWKGLRAIGWAMPSYNCVQVSTNLIDVEAINISEVFLEIRRLAHARGVQILGSELIGLVPMKALTDAAEEFRVSKEDDPITVAIDSLNLSYHSKFDPNERILENRLL